MAGRKLKLEVKKMPGSRSGKLDVYCVRSFSAFLNVEGDLVVFSDFVDEAAYVYKDFFARTVLLNEAKAFGFIEEFYCSSVH